MPANKKVIGVYRCVIEYPVWEDDSNPSLPPGDDFEYREGTISAQGNQVDFVRKCKLISTEYIPTTGADGETR